MIWKTLCRIDKDAQTRLESGAEKAGRAHLDTAHKIPERRFSIGFIRLHPNATRCRKPAASRRSGGSVKMRPSGTDYAGRTGQAGQDGAGFMKPDPKHKMKFGWNKTTTGPLMSNLKLADMLQNRHPMSLTVRTEVSPQSQAWGYSLGSVYIRKVHFRDAGMIKQIEEKVVNRLRQVTSAIKQDGTNQVNIIASTAEQQAAIEFAKAAAVRPQIVGQALQKISQDPAISRALFNVLETQNLIDGEAAITLIPKNSGVLGELVAAGQGTKSALAK